MWLRRLRTVCTERSIVLIFDEVFVVCGRAALMRRFRNEYPSDICFARGTFNSHPYVMGAMNEFLRRLDEPAIRESYDRVESGADVAASVLAQARLP
jgi:glutamate-1-semialdehyde 2,1-aminomutase